MQSIVVAIGTSDGRVLETVSETTARYQTRKGLSLSPQFFQAAIASEHLRGMPALMKEACTRAHLVRNAKGASIGVAHAMGLVSLSYNRGAKRATFMTNVIVSVCKKGPLYLTGQSNCPEEASEAYDKFFEAEMQRYCIDEMSPDHDIRLLAEIAVLSWSELPFAYPEPKIEIMQ